MQTLTEIRQALEQAGLAPQKMFGQNFLVDLNLMGKLLALAEVQQGQVVLEVGPGTGSLTEELLARAGRVVAVEIDRGLCELISQQFGGRENFQLLCMDVLASKHRFAPQVLEGLHPRASLVSNLPYNLATPLVAECLLNSWRAAMGREAQAVLFERMTFTVQREVAERLVAAAGSAAYGPVSVLISLLGKVQLGAAVPATAFWPAPNIASRIVRIDFDPQAAAALADAGVLQSVLSITFNQRRKQVNSAARRKNSPFSQEAFASALRSARVDPSARPEELTSRQFLEVANSLAAQR